MANWWEIEEMQNSHWKSWKIAPKASIMPPQNIWKFTCVLQDICLLGPLPCSHSTSSAITPSRALGNADHVRSLDDLIFFFFFPFYSSSSSFCSFWAAAPKGRCPVEHGGIFTRPSFCASSRPFFRPSILSSVCPPRWPSRPKITPPKPQFSPPGLKLALLALNQPRMPQICPPDLKSALQTFNQPSKHKISPLNLKSALWALILPFSPQICLQWPKSAN